LTAIALLTAAGVAGQTRVFPSNSGNSNNAKPKQTATIHSADSSEGSRVSISSSQSLNDYEAYRRGERFYVRIPASDVPRAEAVRGRGFADVTAQRAGNSTLLSFRLQPGAAAHVEQRGSKLDVVIAVPGGNPASAATRPRNFPWSDTTGTLRSANANANNRTPSSARGDNTAGANANKRANQTAANGNKNSSARDGSQANSNTNSKPGNANAASNKSGNTNSATASNRPDNANSAPVSNANSAVPANVAGNVNSSTGSTTNAASPAPQSSTSLSNSASPSPYAGSAGSRSDFWTRAKERGKYWLLLAQLNPVPVAIGAAILILIIALLLMQRRRAKSTRRVRTVTKSKVASAPVASKPVESAVPLATAAVGSAAPEANMAEEMTESTRLSPVSPVVAGSENGRRERVSPAADEANKVFAGEPYDESVLGSEDRETRRMVGAELLSAMVGRNPERRDRARAAFMKHGYFDDATRDLRVGSSDNERAAAARRLSFVQDPEATPHLVGALNDPSPDVRRAAVEALMDQRDPAAIGPLNGLLQSETDRKVPRPLIEQAIEACATNTSSVSAPALPSAPPPPIDSDREVIEI
jgi:hypothetical protein